MNISRTHFPAVAAYVATLPNGLESYPEARVTRETYATYFAKFSQVDTTNIPVELLNLLQGHATEWLPEVLVNVLLLMCRTLAFSSDDAFISWGRNNMENLTQSPVNRLALRMLSPSLLLMNSAKRWGLFHQGTTLTASPVTKGNNHCYCSLVLQFPPQLYDSILVRMLGEHYALVLTKSRAKNLQYVTREVSATQGHYEMSWED